MQSKTSQRVWIYLFLTPSILVFLAFSLVPIVTVGVTSFSQWDGFNPPVFVGLSNYIRLFVSPLFTEALTNLLGWSLIAATVHVAFGVVVAFVLHTKPWGWRFTQAVFMVPNVISAAAWSLIYKYFFRNDIGILNTLIRFVVPDFSIDWFFQEPYAFFAIAATWVFYSVIITLIVQGDLYAIPDQLHEAAKIDGATPWQIAWKIDLPLCRRSIGTAVILAVTARIAMYEAIFLTTNGAGHTMNLPVLLVNAIMDGKYGLANTNAVIMIVLGLATLLLVNRLFRMDETNN